MKTINRYIVEKLKINKNKLKGGPEYTLFPETKDELKKMIKKEMEVNGNECSLNHIDVSQITDMSFLFSRNTIVELHEFNGDISNWDVSNVESMRCMFLHSTFNGDISSWDVSNARDMSSMFEKSKFNGDISEWDVSNVNIMVEMFRYSKFNNDISKWKINPKCYTYDMFANCPIEDKYKPKLL